jgi:hypothetical protein
VTLAKLSHILLTARRATHIVQDMKKLSIVAMSLAFTAGGFASSPVGDWETVQHDIPRDWQITVETSFAFPCIFEQATSEELICRSPEHRQPWWEERERRANAEIRVRRDRIREIRVERRQGANMLAGAAAEGGLGAVVGAIVASGARGPAALLLGVGGGAMGAHTGRDLHILHGKVIYRREISNEQTGATPEASAKDVNARTAP